MGQLEEMQVFVRIVEAKGIAAAAEQLGIAKSAVSRRLSELESRLGVTLLQRTTRVSSLTDAGAQFYERTKNLISDVEDINAQVSTTKGSLQGQLKISAPLSFGLRHLAPALHEFSQLHPELKLHLDFSDRYVDLVENGFDLALRIGDLNDSSLQARKLCPIRLQICASPGYLDKYGEPEHPNDLIDHHLLRYDLAGGHWPFFNALNEVVTVPTNAVLSANNGDFLLDFAKRGYGIVLTPSFIASEAILAGELKCLLPGWVIPATNAHVVYPTRRFLPTRVRTLIDFLVSYFGEEPQWDQVLKRCGQL